MQNQFQTSLRQFATMTVSYDQEVSYSSRLLTFVQSERDQQKNALQGAFQDEKIKFENLVQDIHQREAQYLDIIKQRRATQNDLESPNNQNAFGSLNNGQNLR